MSGSGRSPGRTLLRLLAIGGAAALMLALTLAVDFLLLGRDEPPTHPPAHPMAIPDRPPPDAQVLRIAPGHLAVGFDAEGRPGAHPRTLEIYRRVRAFPGAPPRIPHAVTAREFREIRCNACHARGGYAPRFGAYTPVTPHPEWSDCLQCHVSDAMTVGLEPPAMVDDAVCNQCHVDPDQPPPSLVSVDWRPREWPELDQRAMPEGPPAIPHELHLRGNCLACHAGPGAVAEIRTDHPERADCLQCHVVAGDGPAAAEPGPAGEPEAFTRPSPDGAPGPGGGP